MDLQDTVLEKESNNYAIKNGSSDCFYVLEKAHREGGKLIARDVAYFIQGLLAQKFRTPDSVQSLTAILDHVRMISGLSVEG